MSICLDSEFIRVKSQIHRHGEGVRCHVYERLPPVTWIAPPTVVIVDTLWGIDKKAVA